MAGHTREAGIIHQYTTISMRSSDVIGAACESTMPWAPRSEFHFTRNVINLPRHFDVWYGGMNDVAIVFHAGLFFL